jgi:hypothetical protein
MQQHDDLPPLLTSELSPLQRVRLESIALVSNHQNPNSSRRLLRSSNPGL